jgi:outer membrane protein OmpA-like peptidoglycan-associated protein
MFLKRHGMLILPLFFPLFAGCAATLPPKELLDAREAFSAASNGQAAAQDPADLEIARQALGRAEQSFTDEPAADKTRDLAYIAQVKSLTAESRGRRLANDKAAAAADAQFKSTAVSKLDSKNAALMSGSAALASETARGDAQTVALTAERQRRAASEARLKLAIDKLTALASVVKEEPRGTVITLSGSVLFATNKSELLPTAAQRLDDVADALNADTDRAITILGFTDSTGKTDLNQALSERRARAVSDYLVKKGVSAERVTSVGKGSADPVADNGSADGRANNRRVEIVLAPAKSADPYK